LRALMAFLDAGGLRSSLQGDSASGRIFLTLSNANLLREGTGRENPALDKLIADISASYSVRMAMTFPAEGRLNITDGKGLNLQSIPGSEIKSTGKQVSFSFPLYEVLSSDGGINVEFSW